MDLVRYAGAEIIDLLIDFFSANAPFKIGDRTLPEINAAIWHLTLQIFCSNREGSAISRLPLA